MDYQCKPLKNGRSYKVTVPGSKSITNRALLLGALAEGKTLVRGVLFSEDSRVFMKALEEIGFSVKIDEEKKEVEDGNENKISNDSKCDCPFAPRCEKFSECCMEYQHRYIEVEPNHFVMCCNKHL